MMTVIEGRVWKLGDHINTDNIFPGKYLYGPQDPQTLAQHALEPLIEDFHQKVSRGDMIVAGENFGCGSSREHAATALKYAGVGAVIAKSFGRIFFRNAITHGLPAINCPEIVDMVEDGAKLRVDLSRQRISHEKNEYRFSPLGEYIANILNSGGLMPYLKNRVCKKAEQSGTQTIRPR